MSLLAFSPSTSVTVGPGMAMGTIAINGRGHYLRLVNGGQGNAYVRFYELADGPPSGMVQANSVLIPSGAVEIFSVASDTTMVAFLGDATGTTLNITRGEGQ